VTTRPRSILVADDDATVREVLRLMLDLDGHRVAVARDGPETLLRLQEDLKGKNPEQTLRYFIEHQAKRAAAS